jgi:hypothetical protein
MWRWTAIPTEARATDGKIRGKGNVKDIASLIFWANLNHHD